MDEIRLLIKGKERETYSIHYSCNGFYYGGAVAPAICCIAMTNLKTLEKHVFALHNYIINGKCLVDAENTYKNYKSYYEKYIFCLFLVQ